MGLSEQYLQTWAEARTRFTNLLGSMKEDDLKKRLSDTKNTAGFLVRHIADVELLFVKNVFGDSATVVHAKTVIAQRDTGEWTNLAELLDYQTHAFHKLRNIILAQGDDDWSKTVATKEFGTKTKSEAIGRIISHTAYHAGQLALILKYGS
jgi:uncharacterized damage-inducible protein DinB